MGFSDRRDRRLDRGPGVSERRRLIPTLPRLAWVILLGDSFSALGSGLVLPFLVIYLHRVRDVELPIAALALSMVAFAGLIAGPIAGAVVDRLGPRPTLMLSLFVQSVGALGYAMTTRAWHAMVASAIFGAGVATFWPAIQSILSVVVLPHQRSAVFSVHYASLNAGIGIGGLLGGLIAHISSPGSFQVLYVVDAMTFVVFAVVLAFLPSVGNKVEEEATAERKSGGYREVVRDWTFIRTWIITTLLVTIGYAQLEAAFPPFATDHPGVGTRIVGFAFGANTFTIVLSQFIVLRRIEGWRRTTAIQVMCLLWAISWGLVLIGGSAEGFTAAALFVIAIGLFGLGETLMSPSIPAIVNDLAPDRLRGRYNAAHAFSWSVGEMIGPAYAGVMLGAGLAGGLFGSLIVGCAVAAFLATRLNATLPADTNVVTPSDAPVDVSSGES